MKFGWNSRTNVPIIYDFKSKIRNPEMDRIWLFFNKNEMLDLPHSGR